MKAKLARTLSRRSFGGILSTAVVRAQIPDKVVVLTLDDAVRSHLTFVAPLLKELGHGSTFFVTHRFMPDKENFMSWQDIGELHRMGFEIGNHSWTHADFSVPRNAARLAAELALVENELKRVQVPRPVSFAYSGNGFGPEAVQSLMETGYRFARRGVSPEVPYGQMEVGSTYDPRKHHRLLIPTTGDAYPNWTFEYFEKVISCARNGQIVVLQFHGVPDTAHPWVHTPPEQFERYMRHLKQHGFRVIALRDVAPYLVSTDPSDPHLSERFPPPKEKLRLPEEMESTQADLAFWLPNMIRDHRYSIEEAAVVAGLSKNKIEAEVSRLSPPEKPVQLRPYPGGRPLRIGFREGAIYPLRGTKVSAFLPWDPSSYIVIDLPEAIFSNQGLLFLAHTHVPTIWNERNVVIENSDWIKMDSGLRSSWKLPNGVSFGANVEAVENRIKMELWFRNGTTEALTKLRTQICVLLKEASGFNETTNSNKIYEKEMVTARDVHGGRSIMTQWERCGRTWGNTLCPCMHSDPILPDCPPGETVSVKGEVWFDASHNNR